MEPAASSGPDAFLSVPHLRNDDLSNHRKNEPKKKKSRKLILDQDSDNCSEIGTQATFNGALGLTQNDMELGLPMKKGGQPLRRGK
jgi:hypothetical protein